MAVTAATNDTLYRKAGESVTPINPATVAAQVAVADKDGNASNVEVEIQALRSQIATTANSGVQNKGNVSSTNGLPTVSYKSGWQYVVTEAGTYAGQVCEVGDIILCINDYASGSASNKDWVVYQANLTGVVIGPGESVAKHVAVFSDTTGGKVEDSGYTIASNVPADAKFTDTTYAQATDAADGLLSAALHKKLVGIEAGADVTDAANVKAAGALMAGEVTADDIKDSSTKVIMTAAERTKLTGIATGAEVNQNAFSKVTAGGATVSSNAKTDTLNIAAGDGITVTGNASTKTVTISEAYVDVVTVSSLDDVPENLRDGGLIILRSE